VAAHAARDFYTGSNEGDAIYSTYSKDYRDITSGKTGKFSPTTG
jgi:hypothetical protein